MAAWVIRGGKYSEREKFALTERRWVSRNWRSNRRL